MTKFLAAFGRVRPSRVLAACLLGIAIAAPARAANVLPLFLEELIDRSAVAFEGVCIDNRSERDPVTNMVVTFTTFEVRDALKGDLGETHTIKQIGGSLPGENVSFEIAGIPKFAPGDSYVVFLAGVSKSGFSSPMGLGQGRFSITVGPSGREVSNGRDFKELIARPEKAMAPGVQQKLAETPGAVRKLDLEDFKRLVRGRTGR